MNWEQVIEDLSIGTPDALTRASAETVRSLVWPAISAKVGGGKLIPVETVRENDFARILDTAGGVDAWQHYENGRVAWIRGIASRVQFGKRDWSSCSDTKTSES